MPVPPRPHHPQRRHLQTLATLHPQVQDQWISLLNSNYLVFNITCSVRNQKDSTNSRLLLRVLHLVVPVLIVLSSVYKFT